MRMNVLRTKPSDKAKNIVDRNVEEASAELQNKKQASMMNEYLTEDNPLVTPYLDSEEYFDEKPNTEKHVELLSRFKSNIEKLMEDQEGFEIESTGFAERHGIVQLTESTRCRTELSCSIGRWTTLGCRS